MARNSSAAGDDPVSPNENGDENGEKSNVRLCRTVGAVETVTLAAVSAAGTVNENIGLNPVAGGFDDTDDGDENDHGDEESGGEIASEAAADEVDEAAAGVEAATDCTDAGIDAAAAAAVVGIDAPAAEEDRSERSGD